MKIPPLLFPLLALSGWAVSPTFAAKIPVEELPAGRAVDFAEDVYPFLSDNCVSCHSKSTRKGGLNLETPADILKGGDSGPAAVAGNAAKSLILKSSTHEDPDAAMPPRDNKVKAKNLTPAQLGMLKRWIDSGAAAGRTTVRELKWQPLPAHLRSILAVAVSADGRVAACARGNQVFVYEVASGELLFRADAHQDQVQTLAFSPDGDTLASGGFREVKLWKRTVPKPARIEGEGQGAAALSDSGRWLAIVSEDSIRIRDASKPGAALASLAQAGPVGAMAWSPDAAFLAVCVAKKLTVWDRAKAQALHSVELPTEARQVAWSADGKLVWTAGAAPVLSAWSVESGSLVSERKGLPGPVVALGAAGSKLAAGMADGSVWIWDALQEQPAAKLKTPVAPTQLAVSPEGGVIAAASADGTVRLFNAAGKPGAVFKGDPAAQEALEAGQRQLELEDGTLAYRKELLSEAEKSLTAAKDRLKKSTESVPLKVKDVEAKQKALAEGEPALATARKTLETAEAAFKTAADVKTAADAKAREAEAAQAKAKGDASTPAEALAGADKVLADSKKALETAEADHKAKETARKAAQDALDGLEKKRVAAVAEVEKAERAKTLAENEVQLSTEEEKQTTEAVAKAKGDLSVQEGAKAKATAAVDALRKTADAAPPVSALRVTGDAGFVLVGHASGLVQVRGARTGGLIGELGERKEKAGVRSLGVENRKVVAATEDGAVWSCDFAAQWREEKRLGDPKTGVPFRDRVLSLAFSPDGKTLAAGTGDPSRDGEVFLWGMDALNKEPRRIASVHSDTVLSVAFSPDGKALVSGGADKVARLINLETLKVEKNLEGHTHHVLGVSWSPDGRSVVTAGADNVLKIWDVASGTRKKNVEGADKEITAVQFLGAGAQFVAASGDGKIRVVGTSTGAAVRSMVENTTFVNALQAPGNGRLVVAGGQDGVLRVWNPADGSKLLELADAGR